MTLTTVQTEVRRDRWGRPLVVPPEGGKPVAYTRATTLAETIDDRFNLELWGKRMVALGLADRPDLMLAIAAHRDDKKQLNKLCDQAKEAAQASASATTGTALHALTEIIDRGGELPILPDTAKADLEAYRQATTPFRVLAIEQFLVCDDIKVAGTADRIVALDAPLAASDGFELPPGNYIADLKTGQTVDFSMGAIAQQLAIYSRGHLYNPSTQERTATGVNQTYAIVVHLPSGQARCVLHAVNIEHGWEAAQLSLRVRAYRKHAKGGLSAQLAATSVLQPTG